MKRQNSPGSWLRVDDPEAARVLAEPQARRFLEPFIGRERTVSEVAAEVGVAVSSMLYRVRRFMALGLLDVARIEPRKGRPVKHYRAVADGFFVPFQATPLESAEALSVHTFKPWQQLLDESVGKAWLAAIDERQNLGIHVFRDEGGRLQRDIVPDSEGDDPQHFFRALLEPDAPAVWDTWGTLRLNHDEAKVLQRELAAVLRRYRDCLGEGQGQEYVVRLAMAPVATR